MRATCAFSSFTSHPLDLLCIPLVTTETHTTIDLDVQLGAPTVIVPTDRVMLVLDLGHLRATSTPVDTKAVQSQVAGPCALERSKQGLREREARRQTDIHLRPVDFHQHSQRRLILLLAAVVCEKRKGEHVRPI